MSAANMSAVPIPIKEPNTGVSCSGNECVGGDADDGGATAFEATEKYQMFIIYLSHAWIMILSVVSTWITIVRENLDLIKFSILHTESLEISKITQIWEMRIF